MASIEYIAARPLQMADGSTRATGEKVPEARGWKNLASYIRRGQVLVQITSKGVVRIQEPCKPDTALCPSCGVACKGERGRVAHMKLHNQKEAP